MKASQTDDISALEATVRMLDGVSILKQIQAYFPVVNLKELRLAALAAF